MKILTIKKQAELSGLMDHMGQKNYKVGVMPTLYNAKTTASYTAVMAKHILFEKGHKNSTSFVLYKSWY